MAGKWALGAVLVLASTLLLSAAAPFEVVPADSPIYLH
jgi:hypothetical protein